MVGTVTCDRAVLQAYPLQCSASRAENLLFPLISLHHELSYFSPMPYWSRMDRWLPLRSRKNFSQVSLYSSLLPPMAGIAQRNFFKAYTILVVRGSHMQVPIYNY